MDGHGTTQPGDGTTPATGTACVPRRPLLRRAVPAVAAAGLTVTGIAEVAYGSEGGTPQAAADTFPTWGTRWVVHTAADTGSPAVGMLNTSGPGRDRITVDYQVDTGHRVCEGDACSTYMAHLTGPVNGFVTVVAVALPEDRLQRGGHGTDHRSLTYGLPGGDAEFKPYRPVVFGD
ncbi:hypothetical protein ACIQU6_00770 [Streptomyces sp. NPDC090442]|uniref:hypothetical protein n=1 Tax=Streptomyces sp. NPDC090442 TaxID=3365962 RepID=UPI0037FF15DA